MASTEWVRFGVLTTTFYNQVSQHGVLAHAGKTPYGPPSAALDLQARNQAALASTAPPSQELITAKSIGGSYSATDTLAPSNGLTIDQQLSLRKQAMGIAPDPQLRPTLSQINYASQFNDIQSGYNDLKVVQSIPLPDPVPTSDPRSKDATGQTSKDPSKPFSKAASKSPTSSASVPSYIYQPGPIKSPQGQASGVSLVPISAPNAPIAPTAGATFSVRV